MTKPIRRGRNLVARPTPRNNTRWREVFLEKLAETSNVTASADWANVTTAQVYASRRSEPEFGRELLDIELFEISLVTHPMQHGARVHLLR